VVRCPVCESATVTIVLNSKPHASCACCGAAWIQEGSWQHSIRPGDRTLETHANAEAARSDDVIPLPDPATRSPRRARVLGDPVAGDPTEAIAT